MERKEEEEKGKRKEKRKKRKEEIGKRKEEVGKVEYLGFGKTLFQVSFIKTVRAGYNSVGVGEIGLC
jgi:hypothetical protein